MLPRHPSSTETRAPLAGTPGAPAPLPSPRCSPALAPRVPRATYRLQFNPGFTFLDALAATEYWRELGITDCYASPLFLAKPDSTHGYDVCGFGQLNPALGRRADFERLARRLADLGLGLLLDMVPNHMGNDLSNEWWRNVLEQGLDSPFAGWFDIDWEPPVPGAPSRVVLPVLEAPYAQVLEAGKLQVAYEDGHFTLKYYDRHFPLSPGSVARLAGELRAAGVKPAPGPEMEAALREELRELNGQPGAPRSFDRLDALLRQQHYRLAYWRVGPEEINYRRFFDVTELVSLRMERPEVFEATHALVLELVQAGSVTGLRIDHPDGLWAPRHYFQQLQAAYQRLPANGRPPGDLFVVVEKILMRGEPLPDDWPVAGTTGYDFLNQLNRLQIDATNQAAFDDTYSAWTGAPVPFPVLVRRCKHQILDQALISELAGLARRLKRLAGRTRYAQDLTFRDLHTALGAIIAAFPVYRTYFTEQTRAAPEPAQRWIEQAVANAAATGLNANALEFIRELLLLQPPADLDEPGRAAARDFVLRFQQLTGPVMAKGMEDTAFYQFNRFISLNEVGGDPAAFGTTLEEFHAHQAARLARWPHSLLATATHDTKRGEDVRARLNVLSELPHDWRRAVSAWRELNAGHKTMVAGEPAPGPNDEYLLYQTLVGAWPPEADTPAGLELWRQRVAAYLLKALKEAKTHTSWTEPNSEYEAATNRFIDAVLADSPSNTFLPQFIPFQRRVARLGLVNSLAQVLLKLTSPGIPDFYQGTELWDFSLVDPDNRRPVDFARRRQLLAELRQRSAGPANEWRDWWQQALANEAAVMGGVSGGNLELCGQLKLALVWRTLQCRQSRRELFERGAYLPLYAAEGKRERLCAFARLLDDQALIVITPRLTAHLPGPDGPWPIGPAVWQDTMLAWPEALPRGPYRNLLTEETLSVGASGLRVSEALEILPVALLEPA